MADPTRIDTAWTRLLAAVGIAALAFALLPPAAAGAQEGADSLPDHPTSQPDDASVAQADSPINIERHAGASRYQTAADIATSAMDASDDVVIASGEAFPDALAGAALEGELGAPVLLVPENLIQGSIPGEITDAIDELGATSATFLGGTSAISDEVEDHIVDNSTVADTDRVSGATRYETAAEIATAVGGDSTAFVATGEDFPDALAAGPGAYEGGHPVLLTPGDDLHSAAADGLADSGADTVIVLGGTDAVDESVVDDLEDEGYTVERVGGANRFETATMLADRFIDEFNFDVADVGLATGEPFADALASAPYLGEYPAPLVLTPFNDTVDHTEDFFAEHGCDIESMHVFGGESAVNQDVAEQYAEIACPDEDDQGTIFGQVTETATAAPIQDAEITISNGETETVSVGANGDFEQVVDAPETYTVTADAPGYEAETEEDVFVDVDDDVEVDFALEAAPSISVSVAETATVGETVTATAQVTDEDDDALEGREVTFTAEHETVTPVPDSGTDTTDGSGEAEFVFTSFETGTVTVEGETNGASDSAEVAFEQGVTGLSDINITDLAPTDDESQTVTFSVADAQLDVDDTVTIDLSNAIEAGVDYSDATLDPLDLLDGDLNLDEAAGELTFDADAIEGVGEEIEVEIDGIDAQNVDADDLDEDLWVALTRDGSDSAYASFQVESTS